jgi:hypothetical protein
MAPNHRSWNSTPSFLRSTVTRMGAAGALALSSAACAPQVELGSNTGSDGVQGADGGSGSDSGGPSGNPPADAGALDGQVSTLATGFVEIFPVATGSPDELGVEASFGYYGPDPGQTQTVGTCQVTTRPNPSVLQSVQTVSAGDLIVGSMTLAPSSDGGTVGGYEGVGVGLADLWPAGQSVHIQATGGVVPAFAGDVVAPPLLTVTTPPGVVGGAMGLTAQLTGGLSKSGVALAWTPVPAPIQVVATITQDVPGDSEAGLTINCFFDGTAGSGTMPAAALTDLSTQPAGPTGPVTTLILATATWATVMAGNDPITLTGFYPSAQFDLPLNIGVSP